MAKECDAKKLENMCSHLSDRTYKPPEEASEFQNQVISDALGNFKDMDL
jgi:hypothetical protein